MKEAQPEVRRRPSGKLAHLLHHGGQLAAEKVRVDSFVGWEELIMNETAATPPNTVQLLGELSSGHEWVREN